MKQKIQDLALLLKKDKRTKAIAIGAVLAVVYVINSGPEPRRRPTPRMNQAADAIGDAGTMSRDEAYNDIVQRFSMDVEAIKTQTQQNSAEIKEVAKNMADNEQRTAEIFKKILERMTESQSNQGPGQTSSAMSMDVNPIDVGEASTASNVDSGPEEFAQFGDAQAPAVAPPPPPPPAKVAFIGAGDSVRVKLLAGVNAPTDGTPYPVVFKLTSDVYGPDGSALPLGEARLIAAAQGSLTDSRALFRITTLNIRLPDGRRKVYSVDGWIVGEDGLRGMEGILLDPMGKSITAAGMVAGIGAVGEAFAQAETSTSTSAFGDQNTIIDGDPFKFAAGKSVGGFAKGWGKILEKRVDQLVPHVQVLSGREATAVFAKSLPVHDLFNALEEDNAPMQALD